jgi:outer membrane protein insertion porin family
VLLLRLTLIVVAWSCLFGTACAKTTAELDPSHKWQVGRIEFTGNHTFGDSELLAVLATKQRAVYEIWKRRPAFEPDTFAADVDRIKSFYRVHGYYDAEVSYELSVDGKLVNAQIKIKEGHPVVVERIQVDVRPGAPRPRQLDTKFAPPLKAGDIFDQSKYQTFQDMLRRLYMRNGYAHVQVERHAEVETGPSTANVRYTVKPGVEAVFGPTTISGLKKVNRALVIRELAYKPGEKFDSLKIRTTRERLVALNLFSAVTFTPKDNPKNPAIVPIKIELRERQPRSINLALGYNTETQFNVKVGWRHYNFFGGGRQFLLDATYSGVTSSLDAKLIQPFLFDRNSQLVLEVKQEQETYQTYLLNLTGFDPHLDYALTPKFTIYVGYRAEYLKFNQVNASTIAAIGGLRRDGVLSGPNAGAILNDTDDPFDPHHGEILTLRAQEAGKIFGGDYRYWRVDAEARKYVSVGWKTVLAGRFKLGLEDSMGPVRDVPLSERFYSGGEGSVRGYGLRRIGPLSLSNDPLGGLSQVEGSAELRRPLFWKVSGAAFFDFGQVSTSAFDPPFGSLVYGWGPALSVATPVGPMRVDLGFPSKAPRGDTDWQVYFSIGQFF